MEKKISWPFDIFKNLSFSLFVNKPEAPSLIGLLSILITGQTKCEDEVKKTSFAFSSSHKGIFSIFTSIPSSVAISRILKRVIPYKTSSSGAVRRHPSLLTIKTLEVGASVI